MLDNGRISSVQLLFLLVITDYATAFFFGPAVTARSAGPDAWLSVLIPAPVYGLTVAMVCVSLARRFPSQVFTDYLPQVLGRIPGKVLAAAFSLGLIHLTSVIIGESSVYIHTAFFRDTPSWILDVLIISVVAYGVYLGIEVIARQGSLVFPIWIISLVLLLLLAFKDINLDNLRPFLENGPLPVLKGSMVPAAWRGEIFLLLMLYPYLNQKDEAVKTAVSVLVFIALMSSFTVSVTIGVFGDHYASRLAFPMHGLVRYISVAGILERLELYLFVIWTAGMVVKLAIFLHSASIAASSTLGFRDYRRAVIPTTVIALGLSEYLYTGNYIGLVEFLSQIWPYYGGIIELLVPSLVLIIVLIRKKGGAALAPAGKPLQRD